ncbi:MAG TPA: GNAT family N-acetyltransferase [Gaiellaceae bacterium]|nr:GNAT family N-acetyltransferase [Gaiellaceae bacterium]
MIEVRSLGEQDRGWSTAFLRESWGGVVARRGELLDPTVLPGFVALVNGERAGLATYAVRGDECELVTIDSLREGIGVGRALLDAVRDTAVEAGCRRLWLVTTNNNLRALEIYQRWGMELAAFRRDAVTEARKATKPSIPEYAANGIPIKDELELELLLDR